MDPRHAGWLDIQGASVFSSLVVCASLFEGPRRPPSVVVIGRSVVVAQTMFTLPTRLRRGSGPLLLPAIFDRDPGAQRELYPTSIYALPKSPKSAHKALDKPITDTLVVVGAHMVVPVKPCLLDFSAKPSIVHSPLSFAELEAWLNDVLFRRIMDMEVGGVVEIGSVPGRYPFAKVRTSHGGRPGQPSYKRQHGSIETNAPALNGGDIELK